MRIIPEWKRRDQEIRQLWDRYQILLREEAFNPSGVPRRPPASASDVKVETSTESGEY